MRLHVTDEGVVIPKNMLDGVAEVDIHKEGDRVVVIPLPAEDPIFRIGKNPVKGDVSDASVNLDKYIYVGK